MSEALTEVDVANAAAAADPGAGADTTPADGAAPAVEPAAPTPEPASAPINWDDINVLNQAADRLAALGYQIQPIQAQEPVAQEMPEWDPFNPQTVDARLQSVVAPLAQQIEALQQTIQAQQAAEANELVSSRIEIAVEAAGLTPADGQTPEQLSAAVNAIANVFAGQKIQQLGRQPFGLEAQRLGDEAISEAVAFLNAQRATGGTRAIEEYKNSLTQDGSHLLEPPVRGAGVEGQQPYSSEADVARRFVSAQRS